MPSHLEMVLDELRRSRGLDLSGYRRSTLEKRLSARMTRLRCEDPAMYLRRLQTDPSECGRLIDTITINVSSLFRNPMVWELLAQSVLPEIIQRKRDAGHAEIRVWSAGCAGGEEAYSVAILIHQALKGELADWRLHVFGTDVSEKSLRAAARAAFPREKFESTQLGILDRYFSFRDQQYEVRPFIRKMVHFSRNDLTSQKTFAPAESIFGTFDLVLCRNVLIYFSREVQDRVFDKLSRSLAPGGYLVLGDSESLNEKSKSRLRAVDRRNRIYRRRGEHPDLGAGYRPHERNRAHENGHGGRKQAT